MSGRAALQRLESEAFDLVLCDLMMPDMTGMELHARLAARDPALASRLVFLTGGAFSDEARAFLAAVPNERISKPFDTDHLRTMVASRLRAGG